MNNQIKKIQGTIVNWIQIYSVSILMTCVVIFAIFFIIGITSSNKNDYAPWVSAGSTFLATLTALAVAINNFPRIHGRLSDDNNSAKRAKTARIKFSFVNDGNVAIQIAKIGVVLASDEEAAKEKVSENGFSRDSQKICNEKDGNLYFIDMLPNRKKSFDLEVGPSLNPRHHFYVFCVLVTDQQYFLKLNASPIYVPGPQYFKTVNPDDITSS